MSTNEVKILHSSQNNPAFLEHLELLPKLSKCYCYTVRPVYTWKLLWIKTGNEFQVLQKVWKNPKQKPSGVINHPFCASYSYLLTSHWLPCAQHPSDSHTPLILLPISISLMFIGPQHNKCKHNRPEEEWKKDCMREGGKKKIKQMTKK